MGKHSKKRGGCYGGAKGCHGGRRTLKAKKMRGGTIATGFAPGQQDIVGAPGGIVSYVNLSGKVDGYPSVTDDPKPYDEGAGYAGAGGRRRRRTRRTRRVVKKKSVAAIKRLLKAKGLKVSGSRRALTARARKARIPMKGGGGGNSITGAPYSSYVGDGSAGLISEFEGGHVVNNNVMEIPGYGAGSSRFIATESGGLVSA